jgi:hypothetical protein
MTNLSTKPKDKLEPYKDNYYLGKAGDYDYVHKPEHGAQLNRSKPHT